MSEPLELEIRTLQSVFRSERDPDGLAFAPLADALRRKGEVREALDLLTEGASRHPDYATGHVVATRLYLELGMHAETELAARRVLDLDPENIVALSALARVLHQKGEGEEASQYRSALLELDPESEEAEAVRELPAASDNGADPEEVTLLVELGVQEPEAADDVASVEDSVELSEAMDALGLSDEGADGPASLIDIGAVDFDKPLELTGAFDVDESIDATPAPEPEVEAGLEVEGEAEPDVEAETGLEFAGLESAGLEPTIDLDALAPEEGPAEAEAEAEPVMDLGALAPDEPAEAEAEPVMDLGALAPDEPAEAEAEPVMDLGALAPDEPEPEPAEMEPVMDLGALAPDEPAEAEMEPVMDLGALAPDEPEPAEMEPVMDLGALAPDEPAADDSMFEPMLELSDLAPDPPEPPKAGKGADDAEPVYTRTLAELYVRQGFTDRALVVYRHLLERNPADAELEERIAEIESGSAPAGPSEPPPRPRSLGLPDDPAADAAEVAPEPAVAKARPQHPGEDVEEIARDLAEQGTEADDVESPFAWSEDVAPVTSDSDDDPDVAGYFDSLLDWDTREDA